MVACEDFFERVWELVAEIPCGRWPLMASWPICWGIHGMPGWLEPPCAMHRKGLPCHRVVASDGSCAPSWPEQKMLLLREGVSFLPNGKADLAHYRWEGL